MFLHAHSFNQPIGEWNTSRVRYMQSMFYHAYSFNQPLDYWDTSCVKRMSCMFTHAHSFNQSIVRWDIRNVRYWNVMFQSAYSYNQAIHPWLSERGPTRKIYEHTLSSFVFLEFIGGFTKEEDWMDCWFANERFAYNVFMFAYLYL